MKSRLLASAAAAVAVITLVSGCGAGSGTATTGGTDSNVITFGIGEPQNPLVPGNTNESNGSMVVNGMLFTGLVATKPDGTLINEVAKEIKANADSTVFDITLQDGWKFSDGTPVAMCCIITGFVLLAAVFAFVAGKFVRA